jgi:hypothetical protein
MQWEEYLTGVNGSDCALHNDHGKAIQSRENADNLLKRRELSDHVQEHGNERANAEEHCRNNSIALPCPFRQNESFGTFAPDDRAKCTKDEERQG